MDNTLRQALWGLLRPLVQLITNLLSPEKGEEWEREFKRFLRKEPCWIVQKFTLYLHDHQKNFHCMKGFNLEKHLEETGLITRCLRLEDEVVNGWIASPSSYPEEFKGKAVFLWKSKRICSDKRSVVCLYWDDERVLVGQRQLERDWHSSHPTLLKQAA